MPDDGTGEKQIWRVEDMELVEVASRVHDTTNQIFFFQVEQEKHGFFFAGDSYVIIYTYGDGKSIVYFWQGLKSSTDEKGASAIHAARIDNEELGGNAIQVKTFGLISSLQNIATQVRVVQGEEPRHFIKMFAGLMVVFSGKYQRNIR